MGVKGRNREAHEKTIEVMNRWCALGKTESSREVYLSTFILQVTVDGVLFIGVFGAADCAACKISIQLGG